MNSLASGLLSGFGTCQRRRDNAPTNGLPKALA
jgi:hypothetical protein